MANIYDFLGDYANHFTKSSLKVFSDLSGSQQYVGQTSNDFDIDPATEVVEHFDNTGGTQALFIIAPDKVDFKANFSFLQVYDENTLAIAMNLDKDDSDPNISRQYVGSEPNAYQSAEWRFVMKSLDNRTITLVMRKAIIIPNGSVSGAPGSFTGVPVTARATIDSTIVDAKRNLAYFEIEKRQFS